MTSFEDQKWKKGVSGNPKGRPKGTGKVQKAKVDQEKMAAIFEQADGDPLEFMRLTLKHGAELGLDINTGLKLARELSPYMKPKLSSIEQKTTDERSIVVNFLNGSDEDKKLIDVKPEDDNE